MEINKKLKIISKIDININISQKNIIFMESMIYEDFFFSSIVSCMLFLSLKAKKNKDQNFLFLYLCRLYK